jgi:hypothetical protein
MNFANADVITFAVDNADANANVIANANATSHANMTFHLDT